MKYTRAYKFINFPVICTTLILCTVFLNLNAQDLFKKPLSKIIIVGNDNTDEDIIERELLFSVGDTISDSLLIKSKKRIENLWLFNRVEFYPLPDGEKVGLLISVTERLYIFPYPEFTLEDRDWKKLTYGFGVAHENFRGRNEKVYVSMLFGNRPGYSFSYLNPWVHRDWHLTTGFYLKKYSKDSRDEFYYNEAWAPINEKHLYASITFGKHWTRYFYSRLYFAREAVEVNNDFAQYMVSGNKDDVIYSIALSTAYDARDLYAYTTNGWYAGVKFTKKGLFVPEIDYGSVDIDLRKYMTWHNLTLAGRIATEQSFGNLPFYDRVYLGFTERVRGHFTEVYRGRHNLVSTVELRFPLIKKYYINILSDILPGSATRNLKFGINGGFFAETGLAWSRRSELNSINDLENFISGFGAGIHILLPYIEVLRIDFAFDEQYNYETVIEVGMAF